jgi:hypothetical protein
MRQFSMIALMLALAPGFVYAQQVADSEYENADNSSVQAPVVKKVIPPKMLNQQQIHISTPDVADAEFSEEARAQKINGRCLISFTVDVNGMPQEIKPVRCSDPSFAKSSVATVAKYRFKPAATEDGDPVEFHESVVINYNRPDCFDPVAPIRHAFIAPPGVTPSDPGADGVYPLTKNVTPPEIIRYSDEGYGAAAFNSPQGNGFCDIVLTISATGKASDPQVTHCERPELEESAVKSLLETRYKPGKVNGKAVAVRVAVHLEYADDPSK